MVFVADEKRFLFSIQWTIEDEDHNNSGNMYRRPLVSQETHVQKRSDRSHIQHTGVQSISWNRSRLFSNQYPLFQYHCHIQTIEKKAGDDQETEYL